MTSECLTKIWAAFLLAFVQILGCGEYSTEQILNGAFIDKERIDSTPPNKLSPPNDFRVIANPDGTMTVALVWSDKFQADYYLLEIAEDSQFNNLVEVVEIKGQSGAPPENTYQFETNQALTYYVTVIQPIMKRLHSAMALRSTADMSPLLGNWWVAPHWSMQGLL